MKFIFKPDVTPHIKLPAQSSVLNPDMLNDDLTITKEKRNVRGEIKETLG